MLIVDRHVLGKQAWDAAAESSPEAWFWHRFDVCETTVRDWPGRTDEGFALVGARGEVDALIPAFALESRAALGVLPVHYLNSMGGPALAPGLSRSRRQQTLETLTAELRRRADARRAIRTQIAIPPMAPAFRGPEGPRCNPLLHLPECNDKSGQTWIVDLRQGVDSAWKRLEGRARTSVRRAEESGITVRTSSSPEDWRPFFELHRTTYRRLGVPSYPEALFRTIFEKLVPAGLCYVLFAELNGNLIAASNFACDKHGGYYWHGFASEEGLKTNALTLLVWSSMKNLIDSGTLQWLDCGEATLQTHDKMRRLSDFKKSFGGELYPSFRGELKGTSKLYHRLMHLRGVLTGTAP